MNSNGEILLKTPTLMNTESIDEAFSSVRQAIDSVLSLNSVKVDSIGVSTPGVTVSSGVVRQSMRIAKVTLLCVCVIVVSLASAAFSQSIDLDHGWSLLVDRDSSLAVSNMPPVSANTWRPVRVGVSWNAQFEDLRDYMGSAWYRTNFDVPQFQSSRAVLVRFGAVDNIAEVFVNGQSTGTHEGGYTPFSLNVTRFVKPGSNELVVHVIDPPMNRPAGSKLPPYDEIPHGKQNWYVQTGGIWQPVTLQFRPIPYVSDVRVTTQNSGTTKLEIALAEGESGNVKVSIRSNSGAPVLEKQIPITGGKAIMDVSLPNPELWGPDHPSLYTLTATLENGDEFHTRFGFRSFEARDGKLYLNGQPFYMRAALDQDFYPDTIYTPPSTAYVRDMMLKAKALGLNLLRCHIKVCDPQYLDAADELGMLVWYEIPSWNDRSEGNVFTPAAAERGERIFRAMFERDWNRPSIVIASIINESWGADLRNADQRAWLKAAYDRAKSMLGNRALVEDNSACCLNFHVKSDLDDFHQYYSIPDNAQRWDKWVADFASRPKWSFSQHGDAERTGREPLIVSEFGNWGLPQLPQQLPWWFERDFGGREVTRPAGVLDRFTRYKFQRIAPDFNALAEATQWHQYRSLKYEIEQMRSHTSIQGYVITELTDINWEANGLMDMWRHPKAYANRLAQLQQDNVLLLSPERRSLTSGEQVAVSATVSSYKAADWKGARLSWSTTSGASGSEAVTGAPQIASVAPVATIHYTAPAVDTPRIELLSATITSPSGQVLTRNELELYIFPKPVRPAATGISIHDPSNTLADLIPQLRDAGYTLGSGQLMLASKWDSAVEEHIRKGGRALVLLNDKEAVNATAPFKILPRRGSDLDGNWVTNFNWVVPDAPPFKGVALRPILGFEAADITPAFVLQGIAPEQFDRVPAGIFYGWINNNSALAVRVPLGQGEALATTFHFESYRTDPFAQMLLDSMISSIGTPTSAPSRGD